MDIKQVIEILRFSSPILVQLISITLLIRSYDWSREQSRKKLTFLLVATKVCSISSWFGILFYSYYPETFVEIHCLFFLGLLLNSVLFFHFVHILTQTDGKRSFSIFHYIIPITIVGVLAVWSFFIPFEAKLFIVTSGGEVAKGYELYSKLFVSKMPINAIYYLLYMIWEFVRLRNYRKAISHYSADIATSSLRWMYVFMFIAILAVPLLVSAAIVPKNSILDSFFTIISILLVMIQALIVTYSMIVSKYVIIYNDEPEESVDNAALRGELLIKSLEGYMSDKKPYLNPQLKITDLVLALNTNRSRLSQLINQYYGVNFSYWINSYRLQEFEELAASSILNERELSEVVGFSDHRTYMRFKLRIAESK